MLFPHCLLLHSTERAYAWAYQGGFQALFVEEGGLRGVFKGGVQQEGVEVTTRLYRDHHILFQHPAPLKKRWEELSWAAKVQRCHASQVEWPEGGWTFELLWSSALTL